LHPHAADALVAQRPEVAAGRHRDALAQGHFVFGVAPGRDGDAVQARLDVGEFEVRKCLRMRPGDQRNCRAFRFLATDEHK
jgi:hypothetical protein